MTRRFRLKWWKIVVIVVIIALAAGLLYLKPYKPDTTALKAMESGTEVTVTDEKNWITFSPKSISGMNVILYPGALVKPQSYAPLAHQLALRGYRTFIVKMPLNLAIFGANRAEDILTQYKTQSFVIGGHSLGGVMASRFAADHAKQLSGVFFLASYPDAKGSLLEANLPVLSMLGSRDGEVSTTTWEKAKAYLPATTSYDVIEGGNHSQFGSYGFQKGDHTATIAAPEQLQKTTNDLTQWITSQVASH
ncbi:dienelactone hydrolase [Paenibacillus shirakamiensis]|uniref:Dienelactone hydrolase n=1 Tax=Paenibacillus shirakamiensis TaxID=1265935 RepID=A0ABS4JEI6_9BACL|nr:alpha/beta hydrolase [Paenibacillus shirakamiensis]MBP1999376.1 dienelactone hydrolase [Paenibacillus shirakamiensis]